MFYRLIFKSEPQDQEQEIVFAQKMNRFDFDYPATVSIKGRFVSGQSLADARLSEEARILYRDNEIVSINGWPLAAVLDLEQNFVIEYTFMLPPPKDILDAETIG